MLINHEAWTPLRPHRQQSILSHSDARFICVRAGRRSGKTDCSMRRIVKALAIKKPWLDPNYFYALPTREQAKRVAWKRLKNLIPKNWLACDPRESDLTIETVFGSTLFLFGMDKPERLEGLGFDGGILDERADMRPGVMLSVIPALTDRNGWLIQSGAAKRFGVGASEFNDIFHRGLEGKPVPGGDPSDRSISLTWPSSDILTPQQLALARQELDELGFREQFEAEEIDISGGVYYAFSDRNILEDIAYNPEKEILVGSDFNVNPMGWVLCQEYGSELHVFDEVFARNTNTPQELDKLAAKFKHHKAGWSFYGDATGRSRKTSAMQSDYKHILLHESFKKARVSYPKSNPAVCDRQASVNAMLCNSAGDRRLFVSPRCQYIIRDLRTQSHEQNANDIGHIADGLGYLVHRRYPMRLHSADSQNKIGIYSY